MNKRALNVCMMVLHVYKKALKLVHGDFAGVQKGIEVGSWGFCRCTKGYRSWFKGFLHVYKRVLNDVKMVLYSEQFGHEVTSRRFCAMYNLALKLLQDVFAQCTIWA